MLVLNRKISEKVRIGNDIEVTVLDVAGRTVRLGFVAPTEISVHREEIYLKIEAEEDDRHRLITGRK